MTPYGKLKWAISLPLRLLLTERGFLFLSGVDKSIRYVTVAKEIRKFKEKKRKLKVLDVGGGNSPLRYLLNTEKYDLTVLDISRNEIKQPGFGKFKIVVADASKEIPFSDNSFDIVVSVASLEHVKKEGRNKCVEEMKRVAKKGVVLYVQTDAIAEKYDEKLYKLRSKLGIKDTWTLEHIKNGLPTTGQLKAHFPAAHIRKMQNVSVWYAVMVMQSIPLFELIFPGIIYGLFLRWFDGMKPFIATLVSWRK